MRDFTNQYTLEVRISSKTVQEYDHTDGNTYIEGRGGSKYSLFFNNRSSERVCVIPAVDGLSVFDGQEAGLNSKGYIVDACGYIEIPGWTLSNAEVAGFEFADLRNSYSAQSGKGTSNTGVIGALVFREKYVAPVYLGGIYPASNIRGIVGSGPPSSQGGMQTIYTSGIQGSNSVENVVDDDTKLGTGFGAKETFRTHKVKFEKRDPNHPDAMMAIYYDSEKGLARRGIIVKIHDTKPNPFPSYQSTSVGCKPPPGWRR